MKDQCHLEIVWLLNGDIEINYAKEYIPGIRRLQL